MWAWAALWWVAAAGGAAATASCDLTIDGNAYKTETLVSDMGTTTGLALNHRTSLLYFSYRKNGVWSSAKLDIQTKGVNKIKELTGGCRFAVNQELQEVHAGCFGDSEGRGAGLYQFDSNSDQFEPAGESGRRVRFVYYNDALYYSLYDSLSLRRTYGTGYGTAVQDVTSQVLGLAIDKRRDWVFYNYTGVYRQPGPGRAGPAYRYAGVDNPVSLAADARGDVVYMCDSNYYTHGLYRLHDLTSTQTLLANFWRCADLVVDRDDNFIYSDGSKIIRLVKC